MTSNMKSTEEASYVLKRDYLASSRLNLQFFLWRNSLQFSLHPDVPKPQSGMRVADVGTGTGIWMVDLARESPHDVEFLGLDINLGQAPHHDFLPQNIRLQEWDIFQDPPVELVGTFDIVHVRLIMLVIKNDNALPVIRNLCKLLKPGGYLQWDEVDADSVYIEKINDSVQAPTLQALFTKFAVPQEAQTIENWKKDLTQTLNENGFSQSKSYHYRDDKMLARYWSDLYMVAWDEFISKVMGHSEQTRKAMDQAMVEARSGAAVMMPKTVWIARKPAEDSSASKKEGRASSLSESSSFDLVKPEPSLHASLSKKDSFFRRMLKRIGCFTA